MRGGRRLGNQDGYTLVELIVTVAIGAIVMTALTSVMLTGYRAWAVASSRIDASSQIRNFQLYAYDDFARSSLPGPASCTVSSPCTQPIVLTGFQASNSPSPTLQPFTVTYSWDGTQYLEREIDGGSSRHTVTGASDFSWYIDDASVVVTLTVTVDSYSETQTLRFFPRKTR